jgi:hypothetical protein
VVAIGDAEPIAGTMQVREMYTLDTPYREDFSAPDSGWWYHLYWRDGGYVQATNDQKNEVKWFACPIVASRFSVEVTVSFPDYQNPTTCGAGLLFGLSDDGGLYYLVAITPAGTFGIQKFMNGAFTTIAGPLECMYLHQGMDTDNVIRLEVQASKVLIFFNGHSFGTLKTSIPEGRVGLLVANYIGTTTAQFDDFSLAPQ